MSLPKISNGRSRRIGERKRTEWLYAAEMETLRMITQGAGLTDILNHVCASIDRLIFPSITTILLMDPDGLRLRPIAGPKVPEEWTRAISSVLVDPDAGLCNTAAALKTRIIVPDVAKEPIWLDALSRLCRVECLYRSRPCIQCRELSQFLRFAEFQSAHKKLHWRD